jgi:hypothetical protein
MTAVDDCELLDLPMIAMPEGNITPVEGGRTVPFDIARVFYLYDVVAGAERGAHAHREHHQLIACVMGGCAVALFDGTDWRRVTLDRGYKALHVPPMIWAEVVDFTSGAVVVVLTSHRFSEADYIRDYDEYLQLRGTAPTEVPTPGYRRGEW